MTQPFNYNVAPRSPYTWGDLAKKIAKMTDEQRDHPVTVKLIDDDSNSQWYFATIHDTPENIMEDGEPASVVESAIMGMGGVKIFSTCVLAVHSDYHFSSESNDIGGFWFTM